jgi:hypothetical protein
MILVSDTSTVAAIAGVQNTFDPIETTAAVDHAKRETAVRNLIT